MCVIANARMILACAVLVTCGGSGVSTPVVDADTDTGSVAEVAAALDVESTDASDVQGGGGAPDLEASDSVADAGVALPDVAPAWVPPFEAVSPSDALCASIYVVGDSAGQKAHRKAVLDGMAAVGAKVARFDVLWHRVEASKGAWNWAETDAMMDDLDAAGVAKIAMLGYGVPWATAHPGAKPSSQYPSGDHMYPPDDPKDFATFAGAVAMRYAGRVDRFEIWNEQNAGWRFWKSAPLGDPSAYGALALAAADAIHAAQPKAMVAFGGTVFLDYFGIPGEVPFATETFAKTPGLASALAAFGVHVYTRYPPAAPPELELDDGGLGGDEVSMPSMLTRTDALLDAVGMHAAPIWVTEIGWPVFGPVSLALQADYLARALLLGVAHRASAVCVFTVFDGPNTQQFPPEDDFGLFALGPGASEQTATPKPSARVLAALVRLLAGLATEAPGEGARPAQGLDVPLAPDLRAVTFVPSAVSSTSRVVALWSTGAPRPFAQIWPESAPQPAQSVRLWPAAATLPHTWTEVQGGVPDVVDGSPWLLRFE